MILYSTPTMDISVKHTKTRKQQRNLEPWKKQFFLNRLKCLKIICTSDGQWRNIFITDFRKVYSLRRWRGVGIVD